MTLFYFSKCTVFIIYLRLDIEYIFLQYAWKCQKDGAMKCVNIPAMLQEFHRQGWCFRMLPWSVAWAFSGADRWHAISSDGHVCVLVVDNNLWLAQRERKWLPFRLVYGLVNCRTLLFRVGNSWATAASPAPCLRPLPWSVNGRLARVGHV